MSEITLEPDWAQMGGMPVQFANLFAVQSGGEAGARGVPDGIYISVGVAVPPIIVGATPDEVRRKMEAQSGGRIPVVPVARFAVSRERAQELLDLLATTIAQYDASVGVAHQIPVGR